HQSCSQQNDPRTRTCRVFRATPQFAALRRVLAMVVTAYAAKISDRRSEVNCPLTFEARPYLQVSRTWGQGRDDIVGRYGPANTLEFKLPNGFDGYGVFDRHR